MTSVHHAYTCKELPRTARREESGVKAEVYCWNRVVLSNCTVLATDLHRVGSKSLEVLGAGQSQDTMQNNDALNDNQMGL